MNPKEKAKDLIELYSFANFREIKFAHNCALIAADEVIAYLDQIMLPNPFKQYWNEVKKEIQKL